MQMQPSSPRRSSSADSSALSNSSAFTADGRLGEAFSQDAALGKNFPRDAAEPKDPARAFDHAMTFLLAAILFFLLVARFALLRPSPEPASPALLSDPRPRASTLP